MELKLSVKDDITAALAKVTWLMPDQLPKVVAHGMNKTMATIRAKERAEMVKVFDRPKPYTLNSFFTVPAKLGRLEVEIRLKDSFDKGTPAAKYLAPEVYGGSRRLKSFERQLQKYGYLPQGLAVVPANGLPLDGYGNVPAGLYTRILSYLRANPDATQSRAQGKRATNSKGKGFAKRYWVRKVSASDGLPLGIYERTGKTNRMILAFVRAPSYSVRFNFHRVAQETTARFLQGDILQAAREAQRKNVAGIDSMLSSSVKAVI